MWLVAHRFDFANIAIDSRVEEHQAGEGHEGKDYDSGHVFVAVVVLSVGPAEHGMRDREVAEVVAVVVVAARLHEAWNVEGNGDEENWQTGMLRPRNFFVALAYHLPELDGFGQHDQASAHCSKQCR